jgi:hypothetical protein
MLQVRNVIAERDRQSQQQMERRQVQISKTQTQADIATSQAKIADKSARDGFKVLFIAIATPLLLPPTFTAVSISDSLFV